MEFFPSRYANTRHGGGAKPLSSLDPRNFAVSKLRNILGMEKSRRAVVSLGNSLWCTSDEFVFPPSFNLLPSLHPSIHSLLVGGPWTKISNQKQRAPAWLWNQFTAGRKSIFELFRNSLKALETWNWQRPADTIPRAGNDTLPFPPFYPRPSSNVQHRSMEFSQPTFIPPLCTDSRVFLLYNSCTFSGFAA